MSTARAWKGLAVGRTGGCFRTGAFDLPAFLAADFFGFAALAAFFERFRVAFFAEAFFALGARAFFPGFFPDFFAFFVLDAGRFFLAISTTLQAGPPSPAGDSSCPGSGRPGGLRSRYAWGFKAMAKSVAGGGLAEVQERREEPQMHADGRRYGHSARRIAGNGSANSPLVPYRRSSAFIGGSPLPPYWRSSAVA
jgi:hypothetical protein